MKAYILLFKARCSLAESANQIIGGVPLKKGISPVRFVYGNNKNESYSCKILDDEGDIFVGTPGVLTIGLSTAVDLDLKEGDQFELISANFSPYAKGQILKILREETKEIEIEIPDE